MSELQFDQSTLRRLEAFYATRDVLRRRRLVQEALGAKTGERILDVGSGPGFYAAELAEQVGPAGAVVGIDASPEMRAAAARRCEGYDNVSFLAGEATSLPVEDGGFDAAICVQVLEYVPDATAALAEMHRALRPGGRVVVWDIDWATVSMSAAEPARTERVLRAWDKHLVHRSLPQTLTARLRTAGFADVRMEGHAFATNEFTPAAFGAGVVSVIEQYVAGLEEIGPDEAKAWSDEAQELGERGEYFFACTQFCFAATRRH